MIAEDNAVFDCLLPTVFHYAYNAYVVPSDGRMYWNPKGAGDSLVASLPVQVVGGRTPVSAAADGSQASGNDVLARQAVATLRAP